MMNAANAVHPSADTLQAFGLGQLESFSADPVRRHLESCADCRHLLAERVRSPLAAPARETPAPGGSASAPDRPAVSSIPAELRNHSQYEIVRELGRGGMGVVYLAHNKLMDRPEVLKVINRDLMDRPGSLERFLREIRSAAMLNHDNVVKAYNALQIGELLVFAMEYVEGQDLAAVTAKGPLSVAKACHYVCQVALGLAHAHEKSMVHRDIKPQNLILAKDGKKHVVKILDFGLAKATSQDRLEEALTGDGKMLGTPDFIAPEQTLDAAHADIRADIYSLGCTLYYLLTAAPPFQGRSLFELLQAHQSKEARLLNLVRPDVPPELAAVVARMMAKDPARRYQKPGEVAEALLPFIKQASAIPVVSAAEEEEVPVAKLVPPALLVPVGVVRPLAAGQGTPPWKVLLVVGIVSAVAILMLLIALLIAAIASTRSRPHSQQSWHVPVAVASMVSQALEGDR
jgi:serine/threonine protein kinase